MRAVYRTIEYLYSHVQVRSISLEEAWSRERAKRGSLDADSVDDLSDTGYALTAAETQLFVIERAYLAMKSGGAVDDFYRYISQIAYLTHM